MFWKFIPSQGLKSCLLLRSFVSVPYVVGPTQTLQTSSVVGSTQTPSVLRPAVTSRVQRPGSPPGNFLIVFTKIYLALLVI